MMKNTLTDKTQVLFFARGIGTWGTGHTEAEAIKKAKARPNEVTLIVMHSDRPIDDDPITITIDEIDGTVRSILPEDVTAIKYSHNMG